MYHQFCFQSAFVLVLLSFCCYSSPMNLADQQLVAPVEIDEQTNKNLQRLYTEIILPSMSNNNNNNNDDDGLTSGKFNELYHLNILCALYGGCYNSDEQKQPINYINVKRKRISSSLFHGIPKFGKRAFSSAFSGIPKFG